MSGHWLRGGHHGSSSDLLVNNVIQLLKVKEGAVVADLGSGPGRFTIPIARLVGPNGKVIAVDLDEESLEEVMRAARAAGLNNIEVVRGDLSKGIPLPESSVDVAFMANVLHGLVHSGAGELVVKDVERVLRPGGLFVVVEFVKGWTPYGPPAWIRLDPDDVIRLVTTASKLMKLKRGPTPVTQSHYVLEFEKVVG
ncbi:MAG: class I SAM-dependent methyltransferase [Acidilobus sp.]